MIINTHNFLHLANLNKEFIIMNIYKIMLTL